VVGGSCQGGAAAAASPPVVVRTMAVEEGHVVDIDGSGPRGASSPDPCLRVKEEEEDVLSFGQRSGNNQRQVDGTSVLSGGSDKSATSESKSNLPWYKDVTWKDVKDITPTLLILLGGLIFMIIVIPWAFESVFQMLDEEAKMKKLTEAREMKARRLAAEAAVNAISEDGDT